jgi:hypothetical protein
MSDMSLEAPDADAAEQDTDALPADNGADELGDRPEPPLEPGRFPLTTTNIADRAEHLLGRRIAYQGKCAWPKPQAAVIRSDR